MRLLTARSIRVKLRLLTCAVALAAITVAGLGFAGLGFHQLCISEAQQLKNHATLLGYYGGPVVTRKNKLEGERLLASLATNPAIEAACLFDAERNCVSRYGDAKSLAFPLHLEGKPYRLASLNRLEILKKVEASGQPIGFVYLRSDTSAAQARIAQFARGGGLICLAAFGFCWIVGFPFGRAISKPILRLAQAVDEIASQENPSADLTGQGDPESARVLSAVNRLVSRIMASAQVAQRATTELEQRVAESNHGLAQELKRVHKHQHDLERAKQAAEAASQAKSSFIADLSQEMRGSLDRVVDGVQELLCNERALGEPETASRLEAIYWDGQQLQHLLRDVEEIAKVEAGRVEIERVRCLPQAIIADVVETNQSQAEAKGITLECRWRGSGDESICCDPERLRQVVEVLITNAIRFTEMGGVRVVSCFEQGSNARQLRIEVTDTGIGIDAEDVNQVFEPSDHPTRLVNEDGETVMGLHNCKQIVSAMGGQISVCSSAGEGSAFTVILDAEAAAESATRGGEETRRPAATVLPQTATRKTPAATTEQTEPDRVQRRQPKILVVDDSDTNRDLTQLVLRRAGARVEGAENGLEAVQAALREPFDLILMDMQMPVMDGFSATREIRAQGLEVPIIALTAYAMDFDEKKCLAAGCIGHLTKPIDSDQLLAAAQRVLPAGKPLTRAAQPVTKPSTKKSTQPASKPSNELAKAAGPPKPRSPYDFDFEPHSTPGTHR